MKRAMMVLSAVVLAGAVACDSGPDERPADEATVEPAGDQVAREYAPELNVDLDRMQRAEGGLHYEDVVEGTGEVAETGSTVVVHYTGWLPDGTKFDSSRDRDEPFETMIGMGHVIQGWDEGIPGMRVGGQRRLVIPHGMAYGPAGRGPIPPAATLVFDVELLEVRE
jgi:FKBP-type peptidyl-prolyl cis-trans isomerase